MAQSARGPIGRVFPLHGREPLSLAQSGGATASRIPCVEVVAGPLFSHGTHRTFGRGARVLVGVSLATERLVAYAPDHVYHGAAGTCTVPSERKRQGRDVGGVRRAGAESSGAPRCQQCRLVPASAPTLQSQPLYPVRRADCPARGSLRSAQGTRRHQPLCAGEHHTHPLPTAPRERTRLGPRGWAAPCVPWCQHS